MEHTCKAKYPFTPGTILTRHFKGIKHEIIVNDDTFTYNGEKYKNLSAISTKIAGAKTSGMFFFGINK